MMDKPTVDLPPRDVLAVVAHQDQRAIRFFEQLAAAAALIGIAYDTVSDGNAIETGEPILIVDLNP